MTRFGFAAIVALIAMFPGSSAAQGRREGQPQAKQILWAAMAVQQPVIPNRRVNDLTVIFALVNDGDSTVNPGVSKSHLFINGVELKEWAFISSNGPMTTFDLALPPKRTLSFSCGLGKYFQKPGIYIVKWQGEHFKASDITFRVLPGDL